MKPGRKRSAWVLYQLKRKGLTGAEIGRRAGVGRAFVSMVISGYKKGLRVKGQKVKAEIAKALNMEVGKIFEEGKENGA